MVFDLAKRKFTTVFTPVPGAGEAGRITEIRPGIIMGLAVKDNKVSYLYQADLATGKVKVLREIPGRSVADLERGADGRLYAFIGGALVRIDPKTAEVISKVLMLAKDQQIKDPTILEQL